MFGNKQGKQERLERYRTVLGDKSLSPAQIAAKLGVPRSTVLRDLPELEEQGIRLEEAEDGKLRIFHRWW